METVVQICASMNGCRYLAFDIRYRQHRMLSLQQVSICEKSFAHCSVTGHQAVGCLSDGVLV